MTTQITTFITPYTTVPSRLSPSTFSADRDTRLQEEATRIPQQNSMATEMNAVAVEVNTNANTATTQAGIATTQVGLAQAQVALATDQADLAAASANFHGEWDNLVGAAAPPYSCFHDGGYWTLLSSLADVTAKEPGIDVEWEVLDFLWEVVSAAGTTAIKGHGYFCDTSGVAFSLTLPSTAEIGDTVVVIDISSTFDTKNLTLLNNGLKIMGTAANYVLMTKKMSLTLVYTGAAKGWCFVGYEQNGVIAKTADATLLPDELRGNMIITNDGAAGAVNLPLPAAIAGKSIRRVVVSVAQYLKLTADGTDKFRFRNVESAAGGYIRSDVIGTGFALTCTKTGLWDIHDLIGVLKYDA